MKRYMAVKFDGWHWSWHILDPEDLKAWMTDGSFDDEDLAPPYKWKFYELGSDITKEELTAIANEHPRNP